MQHFPKGLLLEITISNFGSVHQKTPDNYVFTSPIRQSYCYLLLKVNSKHKFKRKSTRKGKTNSQRAHGRRPRVLCHSWLPLARQCPFTLQSHELSQLITLHHLLNAFSMYSSEFNLHAKRLKQKNKKNVRISMFLSTEFCHIGKKVQIEEVKSIIRLCKTRPGRHSTIFL